MPDEFSRFMKISAALPAQACEVTFNGSGRATSAVLRLGPDNISAFITRWDSGPAHLRRDLEEAQAEIRDLKDQLDAERARRKPITTEDVRAYLREQIAGALQTYKLEITVGAPSAPTSVQVETDTEISPHTIAEADPEQPKPYRVPPVAKPGEALAAGWIYSDFDDDDPGLVHVLEGDLVAWVHVDSDGWHRTKVYRDRAMGGLWPLAHSTMYPIAYVGLEREGLRERYEAAPKVPPATSADEDFRPGWIYGLGDPHDSRLALPCSARRVHWLRSTGGRSWSSGPRIAHPSRFTFALGFRPVAWVGDVGWSATLAAAKELGL